MKTIEEIAEEAARRLDVTDSLGEWISIIHATLEEATAGDKAVIGVLEKAVRKARVYLEGHKIEGVPRLTVGEVLQSLWEADPGCGCGTSKENNASRS